ncbi:hypothetical protein PC123_g4796 [Phytophthora cactorum]|nr:hypothetical protein PC120_g10558 [Phytophthora cactorum]KAG4060314.1 hypothetical protein PC123_g4796 [Phytophthora cactorum]
MRSVPLKTRRRPKGTEVPRGRDKYGKAGRTGVRRQRNRRPGAREQGSKRGASDYPQKRNGREKEGYKPEACEKGLPDREPKARAKGKKPDNKHGRLFITDAYSSKRIWIGWNEVNTGRQQSNSRNTIKSRMNGYSYWTKWN